MMDLSLCHQRAKKDIDTLLGVVFGAVLVLNQVYIYWLKAIT